MDSRPCGASGSAAARALRAGGAPLRRLHRRAGRLVARIQHQCAHTEYALQQRAFDADIDDAEQFDQVEILVQHAGFDAQLLIGERVHGECERGTAPIALALMP